MARILITDDEQIIRDNILKMLSSMGHEIVAAVNGYEALRMFAEVSFDLVITDLDMPVMNGWILSKRIKQESPNTPILMITGDTSAIDTRVAQHDYVDLMIFKPLHIDALKKAVEKLLHFGPLRHKKKITICNVPSANNAAHPV